MRRSFWSVLALGILLCSMNLHHSAWGHEPAEGFDSAGMLNLHAVADIDRPQQDEVYSTDDNPIVVDTDFSYVEVYSGMGGMGANTQLGIDYHMDSELNGIAGTTDAQTNYSITLNSQGRWLRYSAATASGNLAAGPATAEVEQCWVQIHGDSSTRASTKSHTHNFSVQ